jgi:hypothetical protein
MPRIFRPDQPTSRTGALDSPSSNQTIEALKILRLIDISAMRSFSMNQRQSLSRNLAHMVSKAIVSKAKFNDIGGANSRALVPIRSCDGTSSANGKLAPSGTCARLFDVSAPNQRHIAGI